MKLKTLTQQKNKLLKELNSIEAVLEKQFIKKNHPVFKKKYEGRYFKSDNGYNKQERWPMFINVTKIKPSDVYTIGGQAASHYTGYSFQTTSSGEIEIKKISDGYVSSLGDEITEQEFDLEWKKMIKRINEIKK